MVTLCLAAFVAYSSYAICRTPLLPLFARELGADASMVGLVMGASTLTGVLVKLPAGALSDHLGRKRLLVAGSIVFAAMPFTYLTVSTMALLVALRFVHGSATAIFGPVASASLSDMAPPQRRGAWLSMYSTAQNSGQALGPILAGYAVAAGRFDLAFLLAGAIGLGVPAIVAQWRGAADEPAHATSWRTLVHGIGEVGRNPLVLVTSGAQSAQFVLNGMLNAFLPLYGRDVLGLSATQIGWLFGLQTITTLLVRPAIGFLSDRAGRRPVIVAGLTISGGAIASLSFATTLAAVVAIVLAYAAGVALTTGATSAYITDVTRRARYGTAHGVFGTIYDVGDALGPIAGGMLVAALGYANMFRIMAAGPLVMAAAFLIASWPADGQSARIESARRPC